MTDKQQDEDTPYHTITKPAYEKDGWDHDYYDFVDKVDANLKMTGPIGNRPSANDAPDDAWYEATDEDIIYRNDSNNGWTEIAYGSGVSSITWDGSHTFDSKVTVDNDMDVGNGQNVEITDDVSSVPTTALINFTATRAGIQKDSNTIIKYDSGVFIEDGDSGTVEVSSGGDTQIILSGTSGDSIVLNNRNVEIRDGGLIYNAQTEPNAPSDGKAIVYYDGGDESLKIKYDDGGVATISSKSGASTT